MFASPRTTLFFLLAVCLATTIVDAHDVHLQKRDHTSLKRLIRKRGPAPQEIEIDIPAVPKGAAQAPPGGDTSSTASGGSGSVSSTGTSTTSTSTSTTTGTTSTSTTRTSTSTTGTSTRTSTSTSTTSTSTSTTSTSTTAAAETTTSTPPPQDAPLTSQSLVQETKTARVQSTHTLTESVEATPESAPQMTGAAAKTKSNVVTILIAVVASLGGVFIIWTVFRKWKLGSSKKFDQRLKPIDWQPTTNNDDDDFHPIHRHASNSSGHGSGTTRLNPIPDHDFTAGPSNASPVGGYADLARGPSPGPQMSSLNRGPSFNRGFDSGVPLHHSGGRY